MCGGSKTNLYPFDMATEDTTHKCCSKLLEFAATDDLTSFIQEVEERGSDVNQPNLWYGRSFGTKKMGFEERTPIMIASLYGSTQVLNYLIHSCKVDVSKACGSDGATALHCAAAGGAWSCVEVVELLIGAGADVNAVDANGKKAGDLIPPCIKSCKTTLEMTLNGVAAAEEEEKKKEYPSLPDINVGVYGSDEFRMYSFKVKPCSRAYSHDWTECPFAHPGENARRRDPIKYNYSCVPCPDFKKGSCGKGDACEYAHGVFESWLHPAQYRTRLCKDEIGCSRKVCFFAHKPDELRPLYASTGSAMPSPTPTTTTSPMWQQKLNLTPPALQLSATRIKSSDFNPTNLEELLGSLDPSVLSHLQGMQNSPTGVQIRKNVNHLRASYPSNASSSPVRKPGAYGLESPLGVRGSPLCNRSQSFIDRGGVSYGSPNRASLMGLKLSDWGSPDGKLDWGFSGEDASKLRKSASFGIRGGSNLRGSMEEVMPVPPPPPHWMDQLYIDQEQMVA